MRRPFLLAMLCLGAVLLSFRLGSLRRSFIRVNILRGVRLCALPFLGILFRAGGSWAGRLWTGFG